MLRESPLFSDLEDAELENLAALARRVSVPAGALLFAEGSPGDQFYVILEGEMEVTRLEGGQSILLAVLGPGGVLSEMSLLENRPRTASVRAAQDCSLIAIEPEDFRAHLARFPKAALAMLRTVTSRLRSTEASLVEHGRLAGLGTLAAGLTHELNNPAAALARSSKLLRGSLLDWERRNTALTSLSLERTEVEVADRLRASGFGPWFTGAGAEGTNGREEEIEDWLDRQDVEEAWAMAPSLVDAGWTASGLVQLNESLTAPHRNTFLRWVAAGAEVVGLVDEIEKAAGAISGLVESVRTYSRLGRGPIQRIDVGQSISDTLVILKGKLGNGVRITRDLPADLPLIEGHGRELSQVWTNLIDNALDAMDGGGTLEILARKTEGGIVVKIVDDGPGIPPEVRPHIFDPFFTTKPPGSGTGLGLAISYGIVVNRHRGTLKVSSRPGRTEFEVALPEKAADNRGSD